MTLNFYSPKAYMYVREKFNNTLPHPSTISKWYRSINGSPGFTQEALNALSLKVLEAKEKNAQVLCNIVVDEISIREQVEWDGKKFHGYIDIGSKLNSDMVPKAKEALVIMLVAINQSWKIPIGYFLLNGLSGVEKSNLIKKALEFVNDTGVKVTSLTFDASTSNVAMATQLGANIQDINNLKTYFLHPVTNEKIFIFYDPCHMLKLIRNCLGHYKSFKCGTDSIDWDYFEKLVNLQIKEGLHAGTKIKNRHLDWTREKMKVKIAAQTLSKSVSDALNYLNKDLSHPNFINSQATSDFVLACNDIFDIFNSRNKFAKYQFKRALCKETEQAIFTRLNEIKQFFTSITYEGQSILASGRKTGFLGFLICIESLKGLYEKYVKTDNLKFISTYKLSQDHLEFFFSSIRSRGGYNNNPTARQFESTYKKLLVHVEVKGADTANAVALDMTTILHCGSQIKHVEDSNGEELISVDDIGDLDFINSSAWHLTTYTDDIVKYISGFVAKSIKPKLKCTKCATLLEGNESLSLLQKWKTFGRLFKASKFISDICQLGERVLRICKTDLLVFDRNVKGLDQILIGKSVRLLPDSIFDFFGDHIFDEDFVSTHYLDFIKLVLRCYFKIRIHYETKKQLEASIGNRVRSVLSKAITFKHQ